jgi:uncharacterized protein YraI
VPLNNFITQFRSSLFLIRRWSIPMSSLPRSLFVAGAILSALLLCSAVYAQPSPPFSGTARSNANLRSGPGTTYDRTGGVQSGQTVQAVACNDDCTWYKLDSGSWIFAELVQVQTTSAPAQAPDSQTPVAEAPDAQAAGSQTATPAAAAENANLRAGPGTGYARVGSVSKGQALTLASRNDAGDWYQLQDGTWIAAFLVTSAPADLPAAAAPPAETSPAETRTEEAPAQVSAQDPAPPEPAPAGSPNVTIRYVNYDGGVYRVESDEYVEVANTGSAPANLGGWVINAGDPGQNFYFPSFELGPGQTCRVYTNESHPDSGGFSYGSGRAIWNNKGDCGVLFDAAGNQVDSYCY